MKKRQVAWGWRVCALAGLTNYSPDARVENQLNDEDIGDSGRQISAPTKDGSYLYQWGAWPWGNSVPMEYRPTSLRE